MRIPHATWGAGILALALMAVPATAQQGETIKDIPGPIDSLEDLQDVGQMMFMAADQNGDHLISQKEATDAGNTLVGGLFFRADANGDGTLTREEARTARDGLLNQRPWLKYVVQSVQSANSPRNQGGQNANANGNSAGGAANLFSVFDSNGDRKLEATEVRQGVQTIVQGFYATADTNRDGQLSPTEVNAAIIGTAKTLAQATFKAADKDNNGSLSEQEFDDAMRRPVHTVFVIADLNNDGQLSQDEAQRIRQLIVSKVMQARFPEPENSARNLFKSGRRPSDVAPVPNINVPGVNAPAGNQPAAPR
jgi:Ca2+-binding EF-hand superfamily protein